MKIAANKNLILKSFRHIAVLLIWKKPPSLKLVRKGQQEEDESSNCYKTVTQTEPVFD